VDVRGDSHGHGEAKRPVPGRGRPAADHCLGGVHQCAAGSGPAGVGWARCGRGPRAVGDLRRARLPAARRRRSGCGLGHQPDAGDGHPDRRPPGQPSGPRIRVGESPKGIAVLAGSAWVDVMRGLHLDQPAVGTVLVNWTCLVRMNARMRSTGQVGAARPVGRPGRSPPRPAPWPPVPRPGPGCGRTRPVPGWLPPRPAPGPAHPRGAAGRPGRRWAGCRPG
jgi:hypothetical protein